MQNKGTMRYFTLIRLAKIKMITAMLETGYSITLLVEMLTDNRLLKRLSSPVAQWLQCLSIYWTVAGFVFWSGHTGFWFNPQFGCILILKLKINIPHGPANHMLGNLFYRNKRYTYKDFIAPLFIVIKT